MWGSNVKAGILTSGFIEIISSFEIELIPGFLLKIENRKIMSRDYPIEQTRDFGIVAHIDAGKTTTSERILFYTGVSHKIGEVHEGEAIMDWMEQERERGITITAAATTCFWTKTTDERKKENNYRLNLIDTPGHIDFTVEVKRSLRVLDGAVMVFDGVAGVEPQSETNWRYAEDYKVPRICFINKLDRTGADFEKSFQSIIDRLTPNAVRMQLPIGEESNFSGIMDLLDRRAYNFEGEFGDKIIEAAIPENKRDEVEKRRNELVEKIAESDDKLIDDYLAGREIDVPRLKAALRKAVIASTIIPVFAGSALKNKGVQLILDAIIDYLPSPADLPPVTGTDIKDHEKKITRLPKDEEPFAALAFKIATDPFVGQLTYFRVYSGVIKAGSYVLNANTGEKERVGRILRMHANTREEIKEVYAGDIGAIVGLKNTRTGDTLCDPDQPIVLERPVFPEPVMAQKIEPKTKADQEKMSLALSKLAQEDPTFRVRTDEETGDVIIAGMGELHLEIIVDRMLREFKVSANVGRPQVSYREAIRKAAEAEGKYIRQSGGRGQYGHVRLRVKPKERGEGFEFVNEIKGGIIPQEFIPAVRKGTEEAVNRGVLAGFHLVDIQVTLYDGSYHEVDSSEAAFKIAASMALQEGVRQAGVFLLEPIMAVEVITPDKFLGDVTGDINSRRGVIEAVADRPPFLKVIKAKIPLANMFGYVTNLRSLTEGRASYNMEFFNYADVPPNIAEGIIGERVKKR